MSIRLAFLLVWSVMGGAVAEDLALGAYLGVGIIRGRVFSFGRNHFGQLGIGSFAPDSTFSTEVHLLDQFGTDSVVAVSAGEFHAAAIDAAGALFTWGAGFSGRLGLGDTAKRNVPSAVPSFGSGRVGSVVCSADNIYAIDSDGALFGWGRNQAGQIGRPVSEGGSTVPIPISVDAKKVIAVAGGNAHVCVIAEDQMLHCFGAGGNGQLGNGDSINQDTPSRVSDVDGSSNRYTQVGCGQHHSCGMDTDRNVLCWGRGSEGRLGQGIGVTSDKNVPTLVVEQWGEDSIDYVHVGWSYACVGNQVGVWCFGVVGSSWIPADASELMDRGHAEIPVAMRTNGVDGISSLALGHSRTCLKDDFNMLHCYGASQMTLSDEYEVLDFSKLDLPPVPTTTSSTVTSTAEATGTTSRETSATSIRTNEVTNEVSLVTSMGGSAPGVVTSQIRTSESTKSEDITTVMGDEPMVDVEPADDITFYIAIGATCALLILVFASLIVLKLFVMRKSRRRAGHHVGGVKLKATHRGGRLSSRSGRSKSVSRKTSRSRFASRAALQVG